MAFLSEWLDKAAREKFDVNGTNWVVDAERNIQLWAVAKHWQAGAEGDYSETFVLRIDGKRIVFKLMPAANFLKYVQGQTHEYIWAQIISCTPRDMYGMPYQYVVEILKEALKVKGGGWHANQRWPDFKVSFQF
jgi:hypothetical protein